MHGPTQGHRAGHVPARAAEDRGLPRDHAGHRVVATVLDLPVVREEQLGDAREPLERLRVTRRHRLLGEVAGGHDERPPRGLEQEVVQRRVGQDQAHEGVAGRHLGGEAAAGPLPDENDRALDGGEQAFLDGIEMPDGARVVERADHDRERLLVALLALAQEPHGGGRRRVAREVVAAEALHRHDPPVDEGPRGRPDRIAGVVHRRSARRLQEPDSRPAVGARNRLRVEPPVERVLVLAPARGAHREGGHRRGRPVVGHVAGDREAGPAVGAVREGVEVAPVRGVLDLAQALGARGEVGRYRDAARPLPFARDDREARQGLGGDRLLTHLANEGGRRSLLPETPEEGLEGLGAPEGLDRDPAGVVAHAAGEALLEGEAVDPGPKADALNGAPDENPAPLDVHRSSHGSRHDTLG